MLATEDVNLRMKALANGIKAQDLQSFLCEWGILSPTASTGGGKKRKGGR